MDGFNFFRDRSFYDIRFIAYFVHYVAILFEEVVIK